MLKINVKNKKYKKQIIFENTIVEMPNSPQMVTIWGESGSGKTTLLNMIKGLDDDYNGVVEIDGNRTKGISRNVSVVYQDNKLFDNISVIENLNVISNDENLIDGYLEIFGLIQKKYEKVSNLSGGQKQRVAIVRALIQDCNILLLDEPTAGLDDNNFEILIDTLKKVNEQVQIIIVTHDMRFKNADTLEYYIKDKKLVAGDSNKPQEEVQKITNKETKENNTSDTYTFKKLLKNNIGLYYYKTAIFSALLFICTFAILNIYYTLNKEYDAYFNGITDNVIVLNSGVLNEKRVVEQDGIAYTFNTEPNKMFWNNEDIEAVESIEGVTAVYLDDSNVNGIGDSEGYDYSVQLDKSHIDSLQLYPSYEYSQDIINIEMKSPSVQKGVFEYHKGNTGSNVNGLDIIEGDFPENYSDELLIPDFLAEEIVNKKSLDSVIGYGITLKVINTDGDEKDKQYTIVGVYDTDYEKIIKEYYTIYTGYNSNTLEERSEWITEEFYNDAINISKDDVVYMDYYKEAYSSYENYKEFMGYNLDEMYIIVEDEENIPYVSEQLAQMYPNYKQESKYVLESGEYESSLSVYKNSSYIFTLGIAFIFGLISVLTSKMYYKVKYNDYAILSVNKYKKSSIYKIMIIELIFDTIVMICVITIISLLVSLSNRPMAVIYSNSILTSFGISVVLLYLLSINVIIFTLNVIKTRYKKIKILLK